jgi:hypothetical protein
VYESEENAVASEVNSIQQPDDEEYLDLPDLVSDDGDDPIVRYIQFQYTHAHKQIELDSDTPPDDEGDLDLPGLHSDDSDSEDSEVRVFSSRNLTGGYNIHANKNRLSSIRTMVAASAR